MGGEMMERKCRDRVGLLLTRKSEAVRDAGVPSARSQSRQTGRNVRTQLRLDHHKWMQGLVCLPPMDKFEAHSHLGQAIGTSCRMAKVF